METRKIKLHNIASKFFYGAMPKPSDICESGYPIFSGYRIVGYSKRANLHEETLIVIARGVGGTGDVKISPKECFLTNLSIAVELDKQKVDIYYLCAYLNLQGLKYLDTGAAQSQITINNLRNHILFLPSLTIQQKIASILSAYDSLIENNQKRIKLLEQMAENLYKEWFVRFRFPGYETAEFKGGVPKGWKIKRIGEICDTIGGGTPSTTNSDFWGGTIKWVTPTDITSNKSLPLIDVKEKITELGLKKSSAKMLPPHTILMTSRASIGFFGICEEEVCTNQGFISIIPGEDNLRMYMLHNLMMRKDEIVANANGSTFLEISKGRFRKMHMLIPTHELLCSFQKQAQKCFDTVLVLEKQIRLLTTQRDLLLPRLMSGKLSI